MKVTKLPILSIIGPTSIGKTQLAFEIVKKLPAEIISVDSAMIYREMNIGTDKPNEEELMVFKHHLVNIKNPNENYNVGNFYQDANDLINDLHQRSKIPLFVGGTLMYFNQLYYGLNKLPEQSLETRNFINSLAEKYGWNNLYKCIEKIDKKSAEKITKNDQQRIQRTLEIYILTGKTPSSLFPESEKLSKRFNLTTIKLLANDRSSLHSRIEKRTKEMFKNGLIDEVSKIKEKYNLSLDSQSMQAIGYNQVMQHFDEKLPRDEIINKTIISTRQLCKRQITWLKKFESNFELNIDEKLPHSFFLKIEKCLQFS